MKAHIQRMIEAMLWADGQVLPALAACSAAHAEALPLFGHVLAAEHVWLARLENREPRLVVWPTLSVSECEALAAENAAAYRAYAAGLDDAQLAEVLDRGEAAVEAAFGCGAVAEHALVFGVLRRFPVAHAFASVEEFLLAVIEFAVQAGEFPGRACSLRDEEVLQFSFGLIFGGETG